MKKKRDISISELILFGSIQLLISFMLLFNGFTYITGQFIRDSSIVNGPTKQKGLLAIMSLLEKGWWKYFIILIFGTIGFLMIKEARNKLSILRTKNRLSLKEKFNNIYSKKGNDSAKILREYNNSESFKTGNRFFSIGNFGIFGLLDKLDELITVDHYNLKGIPFAYNTTYDGDKLYVLFIGITNGVNECGIYINHSDHLPYSRNSNACLKQPIKIASTLKELFKNEELDAILKERNYFEKSSEVAYYSYSISDKIGKGFLPKIDLRVFFKNEVNESLIIDHKEYSSEDLNNFFNDASIKVEDEFKSFPQPEDYNNLVYKANVKLGKQEFFYVLFENSGFHGIARFKDLTPDQISIFLSLGLFYQMNEIDLKYYELNNTTHNTIYAK